MTTFESITSRRSSMGSLEDAALPGSASRSRISMEEYYIENPHSARQSFTMTIIPPGSPPSYESSVPPSKIQPREDEGCEMLPAYSCSIVMGGVFWKKMELEDAVHRAQNRSWTKIFVELQGTALRIRKTKRVHGKIDSSSYYAASPDMPPDIKAGDTLKTYSLQHADVGIAADYDKRQYVIRVRVEADQFLLSCLEIETFVVWLDMLQAAISVAPPLDERKIPEDNTLPRRLRRSWRQRTINAEHNEVLLRRQPEIIRTQFPNLAVEPIPEDAVAETPPSPTLSRHPSPVISRRPSTTMSRIPSVSSFQSNTNLTITRSLGAYGSRADEPPTDETKNPSIDPETGKWKPVHNWSRMYDLVYAKRCMAILLSRSPRKSDILIIKGKQWIVDWKTGALARYDPPGYGETNLVGHWNMGPYGLAPRL